MTDEPLAWTVHPPRSLAKIVAVLVVALTALALGWLGFGRPVFGLVGFALIVGSTADGWLPGHYRLDEGGATARIGLSVASMEWSAVRRVLLDGDEVRLSPLARPSRLLDATRGVGLVTTEANRAAVLTFIDAHLPEERGRPVR